MGNRSVLPEALPIRRVLDLNDGECGYCLVRDLKDYGFAIISTVDEEAEACIRGCRGAVEQFFDEEVEFKKRFEAQVTPDPLLKQRKNRAYILQEHKEYLKMRYLDPPEAFPTTPADLASKYRAALDLYHSLSVAALGHIARGGDGREELITKERLDMTRPFIEMGSSVSVVRYFAGGLGKDDEDYPQPLAGIAPERELKNDNDVPPDEHIVLRGHFDTGVLTVINVSDVPGLMMEDRASGEWFNIEKVARPHDMVIIMGRKIDMMLKDEHRHTCGLTPTWHRVQVKKDIVRHSILYFFDIQTKPEK